MVSFGQQGQRLRDQAAVTGIHGTAAMDGLLHIDITSNERDVLLRGLRYVRSSIMLETRDPNPEDSCRRSGMLDEIQNLCQRLENTDPLTVQV